MPSSPAFAIRATEIIKDFGFRRVLDGVSIDVARGTFFTLFGPNGAGKTTLLKILTTLSRPTSGSVEIWGEPARGPRRIALRSRIGLISHQPLLYDHLTGLENLVFFGRLYGMARPQERAEALLAEFQLWDRRHDSVHTYSRGMQQRLAIARALAHDPEILLLDEPFTGLDPAAARMLSGLLGRLRDQGRSAVVTTHDLAEGLSLGERWAILAGGRIAARGESAETSAPRLAEIYFSAVTHRSAASHAGAEGDSHGS